MLQKTLKQGVGKWCPSTTGPLLPTMTDSLLAPGREVLYKRYHTGELVPATILGPSDDGDDFVRLKYSRNRRDYENPSAPLSAVQFHLRSPSPMSSTSSEEEESSPSPISSSPRAPPPAVLKMSRQQSGHGRSYPAPFCWTAGRCSPSGVAQGLKWPRNPSAWEAQEAPERANQKTGPGTSARHVLPPVHNIVACNEHCVQRTLPVRTVFFVYIIIRWTRGGGGVPKTLSKKSVPEGWRSASPKLAKMYFCALLSLIAHHHLKSLRLQYPRPASPPHTVHLLNLDTCPTSTEKP